MGILTPIMENGKWIMNWKLGGYRGLGFTGLGRRATIH